jgi:hypothetical protein
MTDAIQTARNVYAALEAAVALGPGRPAIVFGDETMSYGELKAMVDNSALHLQARGIGKGSVFAAYSANRPELMLCYYAAARIGAVFVPGATLDRALALLTDYDHHARIYQPEVMASRTLERDGGHYRIYLRLLKKKIITVVLNTEHDVRYFRLGPTRAYSRSYSTRVAQVDDPGEPGEKERPPGNDNGFLWRLYSYWRMEERDGGVYLECQAVSLTRDIPTGLGWMIEPVIRDLPKESLVKTLEATRQALSR